MIEEQISRFSRKCRKVEKLSLALKKIIPRRFGKTNFHHKTFFLLGKKSVKLLQNFRGTLIGLYIHYH